MIAHLSNAQWTGGNNTAPYVRLNPSNDEYGIVISDQAPGFTNPDAKLQVSVNPNFHGGVVGEFRGFAMIANQDILRLRLDVQTGSQLPNPYYLRGLTYSGSTIFSIDSKGSSRYQGSLRLLDFNAPTSSNTALRVRGEEALWFNGEAFSWGFGGSWNRFARPITIGSGTAPGSSTGLRVDDDKNIDVVGGDVGVFGGDVNVLGGDIDLDGGNIEVTNGGVLNIEGPSLKQIFFKRDPSTILSRIESGLNFLKLGDLNQVIFSAGGVDRLKISAYEGAFFDTNITMRDDRNIQFGNNVLLPEAVIYHEQINNQNYGRLRMHNNLESGEIIIESNGGDVTMGNGMAAIAVKNSFVGIGEKNPQHTLHVSGNVGITGEFFALSDRRVKSDIEEIMDARDILNELNPVTYNYNTRSFQDITLSKDLQYGLIAQEVEKILPSLITLHSKVENTDDELIELKGVNYTSIIPILIKGYQEQQKEIEGYKRALEDIMERLEDLEIEKSNK